METTMILEYNEKGGIFHYNTGDNVVNTAGYRTIAKTTIEHAWKFEKWLTGINSCKAELSITLETMLIKWKEFTSMQTPLKEIPTKELGWLDPYNTTFNQGDVITDNYGIYRVSSIVPTQGIVIAECYRFGEKQTRYFRTEKVWLAPERFVKDCLEDFNKQ